jgi:hypothetical protein
MQYAVSVELARIDPRETYFADFYRARNVASRFDLSLQHLPLGTKYVVYQYFVSFFNADLDNDD